MEDPAKLRFLPRHSSIISLVVVPCQMQDAVQYQDLHFFGSRMPQARSIPPRNFGGERQLTRKFLVPMVWVGRK